MKPLFDDLSSGTVRENKLFSYVRHNFAVWCHVRVVDRFSMFRHASLFGLRDVRDLLLVEKPCAARVTKSLCSSSRLSRNWCMVNLHLKWHYVRLDQPSCPTSLTNT